VLGASGRQFPLAVAVAVAAAALAVLAALAIATWELRAATRVRGTARR
jgi:hypothetical protein